MISINKLILILLGLILFLSSCDDSKRTNNFKSEIESDTINITDKMGLKQGQWFIQDYFSGEKPIPIESGNYINNKKNGFWYYYDSTGKITRTVYYENDFPKKLTN